MEKDQKEVEIKKLEIEK